MSELVKFLLARLAAQESKASMAAGGPWRHTTNGDARLILGTPADVFVARLEMNGGGFHDGEFIAANHPALVMADCAAKRRIIDRHRADLPHPHPGDPCDAHNANYETIGCETLRALALPYADHPDYRQEWALP